MARSRERRRASADAVRGLRLLLESGVPDQVDTKSRHGRFVARADSLGTPRFSGRDSVPAVPVQAPPCDPGLRAIALGLGEEFGTLAEVANRVGQPGSGGS
jgi:hypothetical protein